METQLIPLEVCCHCLSYLPTCFSRAPEKGSVLLFFHGPALIKKKNVFAIILVRFVFTYCRRDFLAAGQVERAATKKLTTTTAIHIPTESHQTTSNTRAAAGTIDTNHMTFVMPVTASGAAGKACYETTGLFLQLNNNSRLHN